MVHERKKELTIPQPVIVRSRQTGLTVKGELLTRKGRIVRVYIENSYLFRSGEDLDLHFYSQENGKNI